MIVKIIFFQRRIFGEFVVEKFFFFDERLFFGKEVLFLLDGLRAAATSDRSPDNGLIDNLVSCNGPSDGSSDWTASAWW